MSRRRSPAARDADAATRRSRPSARPARWPWPGSTGRPGRPWRGWGSRRRRRSRSCCRPVGRRRRRCWPPWAPRRGEARASRQRPTTARPRTSARPAASGRARTPGGEGVGPGRARPPRWPARPPRSRARARRSRAASRRRRRPPAARRSSRGAKSSSRKRGTLPSAWVPPPPTVVGMEFTSPTCVCSPSSARRRKARGSTSGSGPRKWRVMNLISSFE